MTGSRWRFTFELELPDYAARTTVIRLMEDAAESYGCEVQGWVGVERLDPPLKLIPYGGSDGD